MSLKSYQLTGFGILAYIHCWREFKSAVGNHGKRDDFVSFTSVGQFYRYLQKWMSLLLSCEVLERSRGFKLASPPTTGDQKMAVRCTKRDTPKTFPGRWVANTHAHTLSWKLNYYVIINIYVRTYVSMQNGAVWYLCKMAGTEEEASQGALCGSRQQWKDYHHKQTQTRKSKYVHQS